MDKPLTKNIHRLTRRAFAHLLWEVYAPVFALALCLMLVFVIGATSGLWQFIGDPWRGIALIISLVFIAKGVRTAIAKTKPTLSQARRRLENDNGLTHRPLDTVTDELASTGDGIAAWETHLSRAQTLVQNARPSKLRPAVAPLDPYYIRFALPFVLLIAVMVGTGDNYERFRTSLTPGWISGISAKNARFEAWIDPPEYTRRPPSYFKNTNRLNAPEGSEFVARISGVKSAPRLIIKQGNRTRRITPKRLGPHSFEARAILSTDATASYRIGNTTQKWHLLVAKDHPPTISFDAPPSAGKRDQLIFSYSLEDDYGVQNLVLSFHQKSDPTIIEEISIALPGSSVRQAQEEPAALDLTKHKWAGKEVIGHLIAADGKNQIGVSKPASFIVPDKIFVEPLAKAVAEQRLLVLTGTDAYKAPAPLPAMTIEKLADRPVFNVERPDRTLERAPPSIQRTAVLMAAITERPVGIFDDPTVYMALRNIHARLRTARSQDDLKGIPEDLWATALRAEFGLLGDALEDMRAAERALNNAMARRAPQREVDTLFDRYNAAVDRYMEELTLKAIEEAKKRGGGPDSAGGGGGDNFNTDEIQKLLDAIEEANRLGDTVAARKALAQLAQLLENMQIQLAQGGGSGEGPSDSGMSEEVQKALEELNEILGEQRQLRDETQDSARAEADQERPGGGQGAQGGEEQARSGSSLAQDQEKLAELLNDLEQGLGEQAGGEETGGSGGGEDGEETGAGSGDIREALEEARDAMRDSQEALENGQFYRARRAQSDAIEALRQAGEGLFSQEASQQEQSAERDGPADPFGRENGRENNGGGIGDDVEIPEIDDQQRARQLLEELRRRAAEQDREKIERDYLDRLLERF